ncbi:MAG: Crp/Fnr family transcriptional regulator [Chromatiaceae bacterium]|nr:Crp/Fnr family transcriptional regulator [Chromatiaceae bacterium]
MQTDSEKTPKQFDNRLLAALPKHDQGRILANCECIELRRGEVLSEPGESIRQVYFPTNSVVSLVTTLADHPGLEVWLIGNEGMIGAPLVLGVDLTRLRTLVQSTGPAWRMSAGEFGEALQQSEALRRTLEHYLAVLMSQAERMLACTRFHVVEARLARRLLMSQDRAHSNRFHITHEVLAAMLGVRRAGVTQAAMVLQGSRLIDYRRGDVTILDRAGLLAAACDCYGAMEAIDEQFMG